MKRTLKIIVVIVTLTLIISGIGLLVAPKIETGNYEASWKKSEGDITKQVEVKKETVVQEEPKKVYKHVQQKPDKPLSKSGIPVLMYHSINPDTNVFKGMPNLVVTPEEFDKQMLWLKDNGYTPVTLTEFNLFLDTNMTNVDKPIVITFDDGYEDAYTYAYPILKKYEFTANVFLITKEIGNPFYLRENQIKEMGEYGVEFDSHTVTHRELNSLDYEKQLKELKESRERIKSLFGFDSNYICYPVGRYNDNTVKAAKEAGYIMGFTTKGGYSKASDGYLTLKRVRVSPGFRMEALK